MITITFTFFPWCFFNFSWYSFGCVDPRNTSKTSPIGGELVFINYRWVMLPSEHIITRDIVASWNLALRGLNLFTQDVGLRGSVGTLKAPDGDEAPNPMKGKPVQVPIKHGQPLLTIALKENR